MSKYGKVNMREHSKTRKFDNAEFAVGDLVENTITNARGIVEKVTKTYIAVRVNDCLIAYQAEYLKVVENN